MTQYYNAANRFLNVYYLEVHQFKAKHSKIKKISIVFGKYFKRLHRWEHEITGLKRYIYNFSVSYDAINVSGIEDIYKYLMKNATLYKCLD